MDCVIYLCTNEHFFEIYIQASGVLIGKMKLNFYWVQAETHKGLKRVTLICLLCPMLVIIHFRKYHIWNEKKR